MIDFDCKVFHNRVVLSGEMDLAVALMDVVAALVGGGVGHIVFDVSEVTFMDSSGLAALLYARRLGATVELVGTSWRLERLIRVSGAERLLGG